MQTAHLPRAWPPLAKGRRHHLPFPSQGEGAGPGFAFKGEGLSWPLLIHQPSVFQSHARLEHNCIRGNCAAHKSWQHLRQVLHQISDTRTSCSRDFNVLGEGFQSFHWLVMFIMEHVRLEQAYIRGHCAAHGRQHYPRPGSRK